MGHYRLKTPPFDPKSPIIAFGTQIFFVDDSGKEHQLPHIRDLTISAHSNSLVFLDVKLMGVQLEETLDFHELATIIDPDPKVLVPEIAKKVLDNLVQFRKREDPK